MYSLFDVDLNGKIEKEEMRNILHMFLESLLVISYDNSVMNDLKYKISEAHEKTIDLALDDLTTEIYEKF